MEVEDQSRRPKIVGRDGEGEHEDVNYIFVYNIIHFAVVPQNKLMSD